MTGSTEQVLAKDLRPGDVLAATGDTVKSVWLDRAFPTKMFVRITGRNKPAHWGRRQPVTIRRV